MEKKTLKPQAKDSAEQEQLLHVSTQLEGPPSGFGYGVHEQLNHYVAVADTKVVALVGANLTFAALLLAVKPVDTLSLIATWIAALVFGVSALIGGAALYPRLSKNSSSSIFWEGIISRATPENYYSSLRDLNTADVERAYATENFYVSNVLRSKYRVIRWCIILSMIGILFAFIRIAIS